jgi:hypothetical protein
MQRQIGLLVETSQQPVALARQKWPLAPIGLAAALPVSRARWAHFTTLATLTSKSAATARHDRPRKTAPTTRSRKSRE